MYRLDIHSRTEGDRVIRTLSKEMAETLMEWAYEHADATADCTREDTCAELVRDWMEEAVDEGVTPEPLTILDGRWKERAWFTHHGDGRCTIRTVHGLTVGFRMGDLEANGYCLTIRSGGTTVSLDVSEWEVEPA